METIAVNNNNNSRGGSGGDVSPAIDTELISVTQTLAKEAYALFQSGKYVDCLKVLNQILEKKIHDPKVLHNIAIAENFQDGFSNPKRFLEALDNLKKRSEWPSLLSGENAEVLNSKIKPVGNNKENTILANQTSTVNNAQGSSDDFDVSVTMFNIAVILYHLHEYEKCFSILEKLYQNIDPTSICLHEYRVARHVCLLLLDVSLACHHALRAADVINDLERIGGNQPDSGNITQQQQTTNLVTKSTSAPSNILISESNNSDSPINTNGPESPISRTLSEETLFESLMSDFDVNGSRNLTRHSNDLPKTQPDDSLITPPDLRLKVHLYKVWVLILTRNLKAAKREVKMAINMARGKDYSLALFLKSHIEYARNNHRKAIRLLASVSQTETGTSPLYYNNLGCIFYQLGKYQTSAVFFSKALGNSSLQRNEKPLKLLNYSQDKSVLFAYNCGVVYLASKKPVLAVRCFQQAGSVFFNRPLLWLRIAECCIMFSEKKVNINVEIIGRGKWRQLVIESWNSRNLVQVEPNLSLSFAKSCLLNALHLLDSKVGPGPGHLGSNGEAKELKTGNSLLQSSINEYEGLRGKEKHSILQAVLADLAFVHLELGNPVKALSTARCLLRLPNCSRVYVFLGNVYAAEAYCLLNQPKQASEHLSSYISGQSYDNNNSNSNSNNNKNNNGELPYSLQDCDIWQMRKAVELSDNKTLFLNPEEARGVLFADMAAMAAAEGDIDRAHKAVTLALSVLPDNPEVVLTATYIDLVRGNTQDAVAKLKNCSRVRFLAGKLAEK